MFTLHFSILYINRPSSLFTCITPTHNAVAIIYLFYVLHFIDILEFGKIQNFSRQTEQAGESINKFAVNCIFM